MGKPGAAYMVQYKHGFKKELVKKVSGILDGIDCTYEITFTEDQFYKALDKETAALYAKLTETRLTVQQAEKTKQELAERLEADKQRIEDQVRLEAIKTEFNQKYHMPDPKK